ncbi:hypothetical protein HD554DRAFT_2037698 [Boletus coccyginus]|nr:hypothetical protein HD554DRAFT_2037698 [Boletus coccyginus]
MTKKHHGIIARHEEWLEMQAMLIGSKGDGREKHAPVLNFKKQPPSFHKPWKKVNGEEEMWVDEDRLVSLKKMGNVIKVAVKVVFEGSKGNILKMGGTEINIIVRVIISVGGAHGGMVVGIVCTQVMKNISNIEGSKIDIRIIVKQRIEIMDMILGKVFGL